jgi:K+-transporting ATPase ATPase C chain
MKHFAIAIKLTALTLVLFGVIYPLVITGIAMLAGSGNGETVSVDGKVVGFEVIGQSFKSDKYFNGRPSAVGYNAASTGGSNKGPSNPEYLAQVEQRIAGFLKQNPHVDRKDVPVELVTASGGGLDPHISPPAAIIQIDRIAKARNVNAERLRLLIESHTEQPLFGLLGPARINVLRLNIALDQIK